MQGRVIPLISHIQHLLDQLSSSLLVLAHDILIHIRPDQMSHLIHDVQSLLGIDHCELIVIQHVQFIAEVLEVIIPFFVLKPDVEKSHGGFVRSGELVGGGVVDGVSAVLVDLGKDDTVEVEEFVEGLTAGFLDALGEVFEADDGLLVVPDSGDEVAFFDVQSFESESLFKVCEGSENFLSSLMSHKVQKHIHHKVLPLLTHIMERIPLLIIKLARIPPIPQQIKHYVLEPQIAPNVNRGIPPVVSRVDEVLQLGGVLDALHVGDNLGQLADVNKGAEARSGVPFFEAGLFDLDGQVHVNGLGGHKKI